jgi:hypothetical protein
LQGRSPRRAPSGRRSRYVIRFEETGNVCCGGPKIDIGIGAARFICRKQPALDFPFAEGLEVGGAVFVARHANYPFFGHALI